MATQWFVKLGEKVEGPLTPEQLLKRIREGVVKPSTPVRKGDSPFFLAETVDGLFEAAYRNQPGKIRKEYDTEYHGD